eukprot:scaffold71236_cov69-Phaeocystis_antarctica.AAC.1
MPKVPLWRCHSSLPWAPGAGSPGHWLPHTLGTSRRAARSPLGGCGRVARPRSPMVHPSTPRCGHRLGSFDAVVAGDVYASRPKIFDVMGRLATQNMYSTTSEAMQELAVAGAPRCHTHPNPDPNPDPDPVHSFRRRAGLRRGGRAALPLVRKADGRRPLPHRRHASHARARRAHHRRAHRRACRHRSRRRAADGYDGQARRAKGRRRRARRRTRRRAGGRCGADAAAERRGAAVHRCGVAVATAAYAICGAAAVGACRKRLVAARAAGGAHAAAVGADRTLAARAAVPVAGADAGRGCQLR